MANSAEVSCMRSGRRADLLCRLEPLAHDFGIPGMELVRRAVEHLRRTRADLLGVENEDVLVFLLAAA